MNREADPRRAPGGAPGSMIEKLSSIREERENDTFPFPWSRKSRLDLLRPLQSSGGNMLKAAWSTDEK